MPDLQKRRVGSLGPQWRRAPIFCAILGFKKGLPILWIRLDPEARNKSHTKITESDDRQTWTIEQVLVDPEALNDFQFVFELSVQQSKESEVVKVVPLKLHSIVS